MSDLIKKIKIKKQDDTYTDYIPIGAEAKNVDCSDGESVEYKLNKKPYYYKSVADMKADTSLKVGDMAITLGYYEPNDGGRGEYRVINEEHVDDGGSYHKLENNLFAELIIEDKINVKQFGAHGDGIHDDTVAIQKTINFAYNNKKITLFNCGIYRSNSIILKTITQGLNATILFNQGKGFTNFEIDGSKKYEIDKIENIIFESDKSSYWNANDAGMSYNQNVIDLNVIRKYGQRVYIGNKTTTPNNIHSVNNDEILDGTGFWNNDYTQWTGNDSINLDNIMTTYNSINDKTDTNIITSTEGVIINNCKFIGFSIGLSIKATYNSIIKNSEFTRCKIGLLTDDGNSLPGSLQNSQSKVTTLNIEKNIFTDLKYFGIYAKSLLQSNINNNIFQPVNLSIVFITAAENDIANNYHEIVYTSVLLATNDCFRNNVLRNFVNNSYSNYNIYLRYGVYNNFDEPLNNVKGYVAASTENNNFNEKFNLTKTSYFYTNGNAIERDKSKYAVFKVTGNGSSITPTLIKTNRVDDVLLSVTNSNSGLYFNGREEILNIEVLNDGNYICRYYDIGGEGNSKVVYINKFNNDTQLFESIDIRTANLVNKFRVTFNDGYKIS